MIWIIWMIQRSINWILCAVDRTICEWQNAKSFNDSVWENGSFQLTLDTILRLSTKNWSFHRNKSNFVVLMWMKFQCNNEIELCDPFLWASACEYDFDFDDAHQPTLSVVQSWMKLRTKSPKRWQFLSLSLVANRWKLSFIQPLVVAVHLCHSNNVKIFV